MARTKTLTDPVKTHLVLERDNWRQAKHMAVERNCSLAELIRRALREYLENSIGNISSDNGS